MELRALLARNTREIESSLREISAREARLREEYAQCEKAIQARRGEFEAARGRRMQLEKKLAELKAELRRVEEDSAGAAKHEKRIRDEQSTYETRLEQLQEEMRGDSDGVAVARHSLLEARVRSFHEYHEAIWRDLFALGRRDEDRARRALAREAFERARTEDPALIALWEEREENRRILEDSETMPRLRDLVSREIARIDGEIRALHPDAFGSDEAPLAEGDDTLRELFVEPDGLSRARILLPIPGAVWERVERGETDAECTQAARFFWAACRDLSLGGGDSHVERDPAVPWLRLRLPRERADDADGISYAAPAGPGAEPARMEFLLSPIPPEILEALHGDHPGA